MWRWIALGLVALAVVIFGFSLIDAGDEGDLGASTIFDDVTLSNEGFARAIEPYDWQFPRDHGAHPDFQTEWWYYTGNLQNAEGRRFGYQFTIFRRAITPQSVATESEWRTNQLYLVHFTVTDVQANQFYHEELFSRGGAGLAGATVDPAYRVWVEDWQVAAQNDDATELRIQAAAEDFAIDFALEQVKTPALQGDNGLSPKSEDIGNASYYYSLSRLLTEGTLTIGGESYQVSGATWMDHEFSTSALSTNAQGWDWFGLILDDNRELMLGQIRLNDGSREPAFGGLLIEADGSTRYLSAADFTIESTDTWTSPRSGAVYPAGWEINIQQPGGDPLSLTLEPLIADQELETGISTYWEGAVRISGDVTGYGYAELTGYVEAMAGRF